MNTKYGRCLLAGVAVALASTASLESAAQTPTAATTLEEIVVTARKRTESSVDVPVSITAFTADDIAAAGIERPQDYVDLTPNMTMVQTQNQGTTFITVRGISQARNSEPSVAVLMDGVLEANPSQFNQELVDVESIQVLKGPQGALYGRNAIGGAIIVTTRQPTDEFEANVLAGYDSGPGYKVRAGLSGPVSDNLSYRVAGSVFDTDGYIDNVFLGEEADPFRDVTGRVRFVWEPSDTFTGDFRYYTSRVDTQALYFNITRDVNDTSLPVRVNNHGVNERDMDGVSMKLDFETGGGTFTSITAYDKLEELLTGDQFDFLPIPQSVLFRFFGADQAQHQWLDVDALSQELRFTSPAEERVRWIVGAYGIATDRFISTGNVFDLGTGIVPEVKETPLPLFNPQFTYLADSQDNFAWAVFGNIDVDVTDSLEASFSLRYDRDERENTTETPQEFIPGPLQGIAFPGQVRDESWDDLQPKFTLRYKPDTDSTLYIGYSRGFRSGGFNQTGVGTAGIAGVEDLFDQETADTYEAGAKALFMENRIDANLSVFYTEAKGSYFFVFDPNTSTQNLGNLDEVNYKGFEGEIRALIVPGLDAWLAYGYTDSEIEESDRSPVDIGKQAPLVSKYSVNLGVQYGADLVAMGEDLRFFVRADYDVTGPTFFYPDNFTERDNVNLLNLRAGIEQGRWSATAWIRNLTDEEYNAEWSPGPRFFPAPGYSNNFVFKAQPLRWGLDFAYRF
jgi:iron complex outermembrane receptor protein